MFVVRRSIISEILQSTKTMTSVTLSKSAESSQLLISASSFQINKVLKKSFSYEAKQSLVDRLVKAKQDSGLTFSQIASHCKLTNAYTAQLFFNQAKLTPESALKLKEVVPIADEDLKLMQQFPMRSFDPKIVQVIFYPKF